MSFKEWMEKYIDKDNISGDLARLISEDEHFPQIRSKVFIEAHLYNMYEDEALIKCFRREWKKYLEFLREIEY